MEVNKTKGDKMSKKENIKADLLAGKLVNMLEDISRYGTSCRSRIAELRKDGLNIQSLVIDNKSGALAYYIPEFYKKNKVTLLAKLKNRLSSLVS